MSCYCAEMNSPSKKRKTNDYKASNQPVRSLDYFFAKQKDAAKSKPIAERLKTEEQGALKDEQPAARRDEKGDEEDDLYAEGASVTVLSDEELARKLQEQWDKEDQAAVTQTTGRSTNEPERDKSIAEVEPKKDGEEEKPPAKQVASKSLFGRIQESSDKNNGTLSLQSTAADEDTVTANIPFDESPLTFDPAKYIPELSKHWATEGGNASYALLTRCFILVNGTTSRIKIVDTLVNLLRCIIEGDPESLLPAVCTS